MLAKLQAPFSCVLITNSGRRVTSQKQLWTLYMKWFITTDDVKEL